jgi:signal transduction histidine kinase
LREGDESAEIDTLLKMAHDEMQRAAGIVAELRDFNRPSTLEDRIPVDVGAIVNRVLDLTRPELRKVDIAAVYEPPRGAVPAVLAVPDRLHQVFLNLVLNAKEAMMNGGELHLAVAPTTTPAGVRVRVADTGCGISEEIRDHLFDPFVTTKERGLGLGLYVTHQIVAEFDGQIDVETAPGEGTAFDVWLPAAEEGAAGE